jgi:tetratricopeptide (TPR) repeat protein
MGHFNVLTGYDDARHQFIAQDSYYSADYPLDYDVVQKEWRSFDYVFLVVYPPDQEAKVMAVLGDYADEVKSYQIAAQTASDEISKLSGVDQFFAWYNRGTSLVKLQDYLGAARAYDEAYSNIYPSLLPVEIRPWRMLWYQTGPYYAYYYTQRYSEVLDLATKTLDAASEPYLEESYYWRARAKIALGNKQGAIDDLRISLKYHTDFPPSLQVMQDLGESTSP